MDNEVPRRPCAPGRRAPPVPLHARGGHGRNIHRPARARSTRRTSTIRPTGQASTPVPAKCGGSTSKAAVRRSCRPSPLTQIPPTSHGGSPTKRAAQDLQPQPRHWPTWARTVRHVPLPLPPPLGRHVTPKGIRKPPLEPSQPSGRNRAGGCPPPPPPEVLGALVSRLRDLPRIAWWGVKAQRYSPILMALSVTILALLTGVIGVATNWHPWLTLGGGGVILGAPRRGRRARQPSHVGVGSLRPETTDLHEPTQNSGHRVAGVTPGTSMGNQQPHHPAPPGKKLGAALRETMSSTRGAAAAAAAHVGLYGKVANRKVQKLYLEQFETWAYGRLAGAQLFGHDRGELQPR